MCTVTRISISSLSLWPRGERFAVEGGPVLPQRPARQVARFSPRDAHNDVAVPGEGVLPVELRGTRRVIGMRVVHPDDVQPPRPCLPLSHEQVARLDEVAVV